MTNSITLCVPNAPIAIRMLSECVRRARHLCRKEFKARAYESGIPSAPRKPSEVRRDTVGIRFPEYQ